MQRGKYGLLFMILCCLQQVVYAQQDSVRQRDSVGMARRASDLYRFADGVTYTFTGPLRWHKKDWLTFGGLFAGTALLTTVDKPVRNFWEHRDSKVWDGVERAGFHYGKPYAAFILTGGFYLTGLVIKNDWARETGLVLAAAYLSTGALQTLMKSIPGRARPGSGEGPWTFKPFSSEPSYHSFPSGHIQVAMVSALVLGHRVENPILKTVFYSTAGLTFASRLYSDNHWLSDMAFGGAVSWFCTKTIIKRMEETKQQGPNKKNQVVWNLAPYGRGLSLVGTF